MTHRARHLVDQRPRQPEVLRATRRRLTAGQGDLGSHAHAALAGASKEVLEQLLECVTTEDAISVLDAAGIREETLGSILRKLDFRLKERVRHSMEIGAVIFSNQYGFLGETADTEVLRNKIKNIKD
jgi:cobalt-precorrin-5B (C1)-methyltransferase